MGEEPYLELQSAHSGKIALHSITWTGKFSKVPDRWTAVVTSLIIVLQHASCWNKLHTKRMYSSFIHDITQYTMGSTSLLQHTIPGLNSSLAWLILISVSAATASLSLTSAAVAFVVLSTSIRDLSSTREPCKMTAQTSCSPPWPVWSAATMAVCRNVLDYAVISYSLMTWVGLLIYWWLPVVALHTCTAQPWPL